MVKNGNTFWRKIVHKNEWEKMVKITNYAKFKRKSAGKCLRLQLGDIKTAATLRLRLGIAEESRTHTPYGKEFSRLLLYPL